MTLLAAAVSAKIEDDNIRAAVRIICSEGKSAENESETFSKLSAKHPAAAIDRKRPTAPDCLPALQVSESEVLKAIRTFPADSAGGSDGFSPQHLLDLVNSKNTGPQVLKALTNFVNTLLESTCPPQIIPILFVGNLLALENKSGRIRPIAVGYV